MKYAVNRPPFACIQRIVAALALTATLFVSTTANVSAQMVATPMTEVVDGWNFLFDQREWSVGRQAHYKDADVREYVLKGEDALHWTSLIVSSKIFKSELRSVRAMMDVEKKNDCGSATLNVLEESMDVVLYERIQKGTCGEQGPQIELRKVAFTSSGLLSLSYRQKGASMGTIEHNQWVELMKFAIPK